MKYMVITSIAGLGLLIPAAVGLGLFLPGAPTVFSPLPALTAIPALFLSDWHNLGNAAVILAMLPNNATGLPSGNRVTSHMARGHEPHPCFDATECLRANKEGALYETAGQLVENSVEVLMQKFGIDRETAQYWVSSATGG